jgi:hypothetical protein
VDVLVHTHVLIERNQKRRLRELAVEHDCSLALLIRRAVHHYLQVAAGPSADQLRATAFNAIGSLPVEQVRDSDDRW